MKGKLFMYMFVFALLLIVFQYVNSKNIFETYQEKMTKLIAKEQVLKDSINHLNRELKALKSELPVE
ncbi:hypothetical protein [Gelidibacter pelagius]|uniref:Cell division protein FtsL n=1 Tax=Gelidibacter pelagius TaxID=2819985 RepID=A0ABS3SQT7_9FLAO|nr:hypothetical protein [Gelidibacter pelagius]MBO3098072.1 hypothetical protein [Gelidibacter pelagius]